ncbi:KRAB-A domain-containing protein 2-like [Metopolophium dirhodum]|uniref:KRAB-A domain-containing protein 2-like n=1 Tax=Metopolophium dirhodum TaxID=44670 RepID=UPI00298FCCDA|nr:KRAB-A domain-containing protein 2-like [Metopolophium dirhodum]
MRLCDIPQILIYNSLTYELRVVISFPPGKFKLRITIGDYNGYAERGTGSWELFDDLKKNQYQPSLCVQCQTKQKVPKKGIVIKPIISRELNSRCQVAFVDMQTCKDGEFKCILNYQDHLTKCIQLRPLKSKTAEEVAHHLLNIFLIFGAPNILHSDNEREFVNKVISELCSMWDGVKIVHGKPRHSQTQGSIERTNQDFQNILRAMMEDNDTTKWSEALPFVQFAKNTTYHQAPQTDLENKGSDDNEVEKESNGKSDDNLDNQANNDEDKLSEKSDDKNQNELLNKNERKENTIKNRALALNGLQTQASVMLRSSNQKFPPAQVGDTV